MLPNPTVRTVASDEVASAQLALGPCCRYAHRDVGVILFEPDEFMPAQYGDAAGDCAELELLLESALRNREDVQGTAKQTEVQGERAVAEPPRPDHAQTRPVQQAAATQLHRCSSHDAVRLRHFARVGRGLYHERARARGGELCGQ